MLTSIRETAPRIIPCKSLVRKNNLLFNGEPLHTEKIWKWTHNPPNPTVNPVKKAQSNIFSNETASNEPLQNSINMYKNDEIVSFNELPSKEEIAVIKTEKVAINAIIIITLWALELTASVKDLM